MEHSLYLSDAHLTELKRLIQSLYPKAIVLAYGSRVGGDETTAHSGSDLDLAVLDFGCEDYDLWELKEVLVESNLPFLIDLFDYKRLPKSFQEEIDRKHVVICQPF